MAWGSLISAGVGLLGSAISNKKASSAADSASAAEAEYAAQGKEYGDRIKALADGLQSEYGDIEARLGSIGKLLGEGQFYEAQQREYNRLQDESMGKIKELFSQGVAKNLRDMGTMKSTLGDDLMLKTSEAINEATAVNDQVALDNTIARYGKLKGLRQGEFDEAQRQANDVANLLSAAGGIATRTGASVLNSRNAAADRASQQAYLSSQGAGYALNKAVNEINWDKVFSALGGGGGRISNGSILDMMPSDI
jgi:hypothetical protein